MKKKRIALAMVTATLFLTSTGSLAESFTAETVNNINTTSNGVKSSKTSQAAKINNNLYVSLPSLSDTLNKYVDYNEFTNTVSFTDKPLLKTKYSLKADDLAKGIKMGVGSSLIHLPGDPFDIFYSTADRGPNGDITVNGASAKSFPLPTYTPSIYKIQIVDGVIKILNQTPLQVKGTNPVTGTSKITGLPNIKGRDEVPYDANGTTELSYDPYGLDIEGLAYNAKDDTFWISDEYGPSIVHVKRDGTIIERIVPNGWTSKISTPLVPAIETLPAIYNKLRSNRGAEAVSITPDSKYMFMAMQSPLRNPDKSVDSSRQLRIIKFDLNTLKPVAEFCYVTEDAKNYTGLSQADIVISDLVAVNENLLLVDERDKNAGEKAQLKKIFAADLSTATNILGKYDDATVGKTLEQMTIADIKTNSIMPSSKRTILDAVEFKFPYEKIEGISLVNRNTIAIINDNDFGIGSSSSENGTIMWTFKLPYKIN